MEQQYPPTPPTPSPPAPPPVSKKWTAKETLTVIFLVLIPIVGLILMWVIANWSTKVKIIITVVLLLLFSIIVLVIWILSSIVLVSLGEARERARDARKYADMRQISTAQEIYYRDNEQYYQSVNYPISIPDILPALEMPADPATDGPYGWIDNTGDSQRFCVYADLEKDGFVVATHRGVRGITTEPRTLSDCVKVPKLY